MSGTPVDPNRDVELVESSPGSSDVAHPDLDSRAAQPLDLNAISLKNPSDLLTIEDIDRDLQIAEAELGDVAEAAANVVLQEQETQQEPRETSPETVVRGSSVPIIDDIDDVPEDIPGYELDDDDDDVDVDVEDAEADISASKSDNPSKPKDLKDPEEPDAVETVRSARRAAIRHKLRQEIPTVPLALPPERAVLQEIVSLMVTSAGCEPISGEIITELLFHTEEYFSMVISAVKKLALVQRRARPAVRDVSAALKLFGVSTSALTLEMARTMKARTAKPQFAEKIAGLQPLLLQQYRNPETLEPASYFGHDLQVKTDWEQITELIPPSRDRPEYIPEWMPSFPPDHTYMSTLTNSTQRESDPRKLRELLVEEGRLGELGLRKLMAASEKARRVGLGNCAPSAPSAGSDGFGSQEISGNSRSELTAGDSQDMPGIGAQTSDLPEPGDVSGAATPPAVAAVDFSSPLSDLSANPSAASSPGISTIPVSPYRVGEGSNRADGFDIVAFARRRLHARETRRDRANLRRELRQRDAFYTIGKYLSPYTEVHLETLTKASSIRAKTREINRELVRAYAGEFNVAVRCVEAIDKKLMAIAQEKRDEEIAAKERAAQEKSRSPEKEEMTFGFGFDDDDDEIGGFAGYSPGEEGEGVVIVESGGQRGEKSDGQADSTEGMIVVDEGGSKNGGDGGDGDGDSGMILVEEPGRSSEGNVEMGNGSGSGGAVPTKSPVLRFNLGAPDESEADTPSGSESDAD